MLIPSTIVAEVNDHADIMENPYFSHALAAIKSMNEITEDLYCYDFMMIEINALERLYKGFLKSATKICDWYHLPTEDFLTKDHDILGMVLEIKDHFPGVFPRVEREVWRDTKKFLKDLRCEYTKCRYESYPTFEEFKAVRTYVNSQSKLLENYLRSGKMEQTNDQELPLDL